jgi:hypothetical protein
VGKGISLRSQLLDIVLIRTENLPGADLAYGNRFALIHEQISKEAGPAGIAAKESKVCSKGRQG